MVKVEKYNPFNIKEYLILDKDGEKKLCIDNMELELSKDGYIPKSGLLFENALKIEDCKDKKVLDLGCGYLGILGVIAHLRGASHIDSIDYDEKCVDWFKKLILDNNLSNFNCFISDYYQNIKDNDYDIILSNPPQMPMVNGSVHDSGGIDGRKYILQILNESIDHLKEHGKLYILLFDFLGIEQSFNDDLSIIEIAQKIGYKNPSIIFDVDKIIKKGSVTYESIKHIQKQYPLYRFENADEYDKKCKIKILRLEK